MSSFTEPAVQTPTRPDPRPGIGPAPMSEPSAPSYPRVSLLLEIWRRWRRRILLWTPLVAAVVCGILLLIPRRYTASATILLSSSKASGFSLPSLGPLSGMLDALDSPIASGLSGGGQSDRYLAILTSDRVAETVIEHNGLRAYYDNPPRWESLLTAYRDHLGSELNKSKTILTISYDHRDPKQAQQIVQDLVATLDTVNIRLQADAVGRSRAFLGTRLAETQANLARAEDSLQAFQQKYKIYSLQGQVSAAVTMTSQLEAQRRAKQIELDIKRQTLGPDHPEVRETERAVAALERQVREMTRSSGNGSEVLPSLNRAPEVGRRYLTLYRDVTIQNRLLEVLIPLYEQSRADEQKNLSTVQVLDGPRVPQKPSWPKRMRWAVTAMLLWFVGLAVYIALVERAGWLRRTRPTEYDELAAMLRGRRR